MSLVVNAKELTREQKLSDIEKLMKLADISDYVTSYLSRNEATHEQIMSELDKLSEQQLEYILVECARMWIAEFGNLEPLAHCAKVVASANAVSLLPALEEELGVVDFNQDILVEFDGEVKTMYFHVDFPHGWSIRGAVGVYTQEYLLVLLKEGRVVVAR